MVFKIAGACESWGFRACNDVLSGEHTIATKEEAFTEPDSVVSIYCLQVCTKDDST